MILLSIWVFSTKLVRIAVICALYIMIGIGVTAGSTIRHKTTLSDENNTKAVLLWPTIVVMEAYLMWTEPSVDPRVYQ